MFEIEKNVPIDGRQPYNRYPFGEMEVNDSFFVADGKQSRLSAAATASGKTHGTKFTVRKVDGGYRIWRIA